MLGKSFQDNIGQEYASLKFNKNHIQVLSDFMTGYFLCHASVHAINTGLDLHHTIFADHLLSPDKVQKFACKLDFWYIVEESDAHLKSVYFSHRFIFSLNDWQIALL